MTESKKKDLKNYTFNFLSINTLASKQKLRSFLLIVFSLVFSIGLILFSAFEVHQTQAQSQMGLDQESTQSSTEAEEATSSQETADLQASQSIDYYLPYPGILPDHPLYWLKMLRDKILLLVTRDPIAKTERQLLYADKRLGAAKALIEGGKIQLGVTTATKGEKYLEQVISSVEELDSQNKISSELKQKVFTSALKHHQVLTQAGSNLSGEAGNLINQAAEKTLQTSSKLKN
jgi:hypothetical protein